MCVLIYKEGKGNIAFLSRSHLIIGHYYISQLSKNYTPILEPFGVTIRKKKNHQRRIQT